jgi:DNA-binding transcriptional LysR family regulator
MKNLPLTALKTFEAAARLHSFSKAGDELFVTHAAVSHQIKKLEEWFDTKLFERKSRGVELTRAGAMLYRVVSPAFEEISEVCTRVKGLSGREMITVGCIASIATRWLVPRLNEFFSIRPDSEVRVVYATADEKLSTGDLDVLITTGMENDQGCVSKRLFSRTNKPVCSPLFLEKYGPFDSPEQFAKVPLLHDEYRDGWRKWFKAQGMSLPENDNSPVYPDFNLLATAVIAGHGMALCPVEVFRHEIEQGDLIILSDASVNTGAAYYVSFRQPASNLTVDFVNWFREACFNDNKL